MKPFFAALALILSSTCTFAQDTEEEFVFRVKVAASTTPISKTSKLYKDFPDLKAITFDDGYIRYFTGEYETFHRAKEALPAVHAKGYKDAYVAVVHEGKVLSGDEAIMKIYGEEE